MDTTPPEPAVSPQRENLRAGFFAEYWPRLLAVSALVIAPCLWHKHIEAGDLSSHVYNAWLAHLIVTGQAPGLYIAHQWNNVLFDIALERTARVVGLQAAERIVTSLAVLIFFWGAFALVYAMTGPSDRKAVDRKPARDPLAHQDNVPWLVLPVLAMLAYGYTFEMGFMNFYISFGLAFFALALLLRASPGAGESAGRAAPVAGKATRKKAGKATRKKDAMNFIGILLLIPFIWLAHPLGMFLLVAAGTYIFLARRLAPQLQLALFGASALLLLAARFYIVAHYPFSWRAGLQVIQDGADQLLIYGRHYFLPSYALRVFFCAALLWDVFTRLRSRPDEGHSNGWSNYFLPLQLYVLALLAAWWLPSVVRLPQYASPVGLITQRLTTLSGVLLCCLFAVMRPRKWHLAGLAAIAAVFFVFLYQDTAKFNDMEDQAARYERLLPPGQRILATIFPLPSSRVFIDHMVDRACVGWCFSYENYEPPSLQFRVRARPGNPMVMTSAENEDAAEGGNYIVQPEDLPAFQIYQCDLTRTVLCMRELSAGEANGSVGLHLR